MYLFLFSYADIFGLDETKQSLKCFLESKDFEKIVGTAPGLSLLCFLIPKLAASIESGSKQSVVKCSLQNGKLQKLSSELLLFAPAFPTGI